VNLTPSLPPDRHPTANPEIYPFESAILLGNAAQQIVIGCRGQEVANIRESIELKGRWTGCLSEPI
jgi:hypothetical protein